MQHCSDRLWRDYPSCICYPDFGQGILFVTAHAEKNNYFEQHGRTALISARIAHTQNIVLPTTSRVPMPKGMGETQPATKPGDCKGPVSKKLIACLQPDRRVEVDVEGSKEVTVPQ